MTRAPLDYAPDDERNEPVPRPFSWRPVIILFAFQIAIIGAFAWVVFHG